MELTYVLLFFLLSFFFNGSETAFVSVNRIKLHSRLENRDRRAKILSYLLHNSENFIGTIVLATNICDVAIILNFNEFMIKTFGRIPLLPVYNTLILTPVIAIFATLIPKVIFREYADEIMYPFSYLYFLIYLILYPVQFLFLRTIKIFLWLLGLRKKKDFFSRDEFNILIDMTVDKGIIKQNEKRIIENIMNFKNIKAKEIMVPLIRMTCVEENDTVEIASALMLSTGHNRLPVFRIRVDNMLGYVENKDLLKASRQDRVGNYIREGIFVPELASISQVLINMQEKAVQMAFVVDEYGGVEGVITNQGIITEIIGEFVDIKEDRIKKEGNSYVVSGIMGIDELNEELNLKIKKVDFETIAGFVVYKMEKIPKPGEKFEDGGYEFEVVSSTPVRVKSVRITPKKKREKRRKI